MLQGQLHNENDEDLEDDDEEDEDHAMDLDSDMVNHNYIISIKSFPNTAFLKQPDQTAHIFLVFCI